MKKEKKNLFLFVLAIMIALVPAAAFSGLPVPGGIISLPETGQTTSYAPRDDGALQMGVEWPGTSCASNGNPDTDTMGYDSVHASRCSRSCLLPVSPPASPNRGEKADLRRRRIV